MMDREKASQAAEPATPFKDSSEDLETTPFPRHVRLHSTSSMITSPSGSDGPTPTARKLPLVEEEAIQDESQSGPSDQEESTDGDEGDEDQHSSSASRRYLAEEVASEANQHLSEATPLLGGSPQGRGSSKTGRIGQTLSAISQRAKKLTPRDIVRGCVEEPIKTLPSVILGVLLNVLDGVSYGMIL